MKHTLFVSFMNRTNVDGSEIETPMAIGTTADLALDAAMQKRGGSYTRDTSWLSGLPFYVQDRDDGVYVTMDCQKVETVDDGDLGEYVYAFFVEYYRENPHYEHESLIFVAADRKAGMEYAHQKFPKLHFATWGNRDPILTSDDHTVSITAQKVRLTDGKYVSYEVPKKSLYEEILEGLDTTDLI